MGNARDSKIGSKVANVMKTALAKKPTQIGDSAGQKLPLRQRLLQGADQKIVNLQDDLLKVSQGLAGAKRGSFLQVLDAVKRTGKRASAGVNAVVIDNGSGNWNNNGCGGCGGGNWNNNGGNCGSWDGNSGSSWNNGGK